MCEGLGSFVGLIPLWQLDFFLLNLKIRGYEGMAADMKV